MSNEQSPSTPAKSALGLRCFPFFTMEALDQRRQHSLQLISLTRKPSKIVTAQQPEIMSKKQVILGLPCGSTSYLQENDKSRYLIASPNLPLYSLQSRPPNDAADWSIRTVPPSEIHEWVVDVESHPVRFLPHNKFLEVLHHGSYHAMCLLIAHRSLLVAR